MVTDDLVQLGALIARGNIHFTRASDGSIAVRNSGPALTVEERRALLACRDLIHFHVEGLRTGHALAPCSACGLPSIVAVRRPDGQVRKTWPECRLTPGCEGHHGPTATDITARPTAPPAQAAQPRKPDRRRLITPTITWPEDAA